MISDYSTVSEPIVQEQQVKERSASAKAIFKLILITVAAYKLYTVLDFITVKKRKR